jgi:hypothetical protein
MSPMTRFFLTMARTSYGWNKIMESMGDGGDETEHRGIGLFSSLPYNP